MTTTITLLDNGSDRYTQERDSKYFGRKWDNIAEAVKVLFPEVELEANSACYMIVVHENAQIDSILVGNNVPFDVTNVLSRHDRIKVGFSFQRPDGYVKNSEWQYYYFHDALKPEDYVPVDPEQEEQFNLLLGYAFTNVDWKAGTRNVLEFKNMAGGVVKEIELSPFVQEQADLAEQDPDAETYVKHKSTIYLANEGSDGTSPYAEIKDLPTKTSDLENDGDGESAFATLDDLPTKTSDLQNDGDGESPFATEDYVNENGGKIDEIYLNDVEQTITDKKVHLTVDKNTVGLSNVDNTSDANKPVSTAQQNAINAVANSIGNGQITITQGGTTKGTFTVNQSGNTTIALDAGGGGGTGDYPDLTNKPQINGVTLVGNLSSSDLSLATSTQGALADTALQPSDVDSALSDSSENPVQNKVLAVLIPSDASDENQLTTYNFVNSSINNMAAFYITRNAQGDPFQTKAQLDATTTFYSGGEVRVPTKNDYCIVIADISQADVVSEYGSFTTTAQYIGYHIIYDNTDTLVTVDNKDSIGITAGTTPCYYSIPTTRYTYQGSQWEFQYIVNKTSLTAAQIAAINSGITASLVAQISTNQGNISTLNTTKANDADVVHLAGPETITGKKTFDGNIGVASQIDIGTGSIKYLYNNINFNLNGNDVYLFASSTFQPNGSTNSKKIDLGGENRYWKDLYLSGNLTDGTNSLTIEQINNKLDKVTTAAGDRRLYAINANGTQTTVILDYSNTASAGRVPCRSSTGALMINDSTYNNPGQFDDGLQAINKNKLIERTTALSGNGAPTTSTVGFVGQLYRDTTNDKLYICDGITEDTSTTPSTFTYTWTQLIKFTDKASSSAYGIVKIAQGRGLDFLSDGGLYVDVAGTTQIDNRTIGRPIAAAQLNYAVKAALSDANHLTMTAAEQAVAQSVLGISGGGSVDIDDSSITENANNEIQAVGVISTNGLVSADEIDLGLTVQIYEAGD